MESEACLAPSPLSKTQSHKNLKWVCRKVLSPALLPKRHLRGKSIKWKRRRKKGRAGRHDRERSRITHERMDGEEGKKGARTCRLPKSHSKNKEKRKKKSSTSVLSSR